MEQLQTLFQNLEKQQIFTTRIKKKIKYPQPRKTQPFRCECLNLVTPVLYVTKRFTSYSYINQCCLIRNTVCPMSVSLVEVDAGIFVFYNIYLHCGLLSRPLEESVRICDLQNPNSQNTYIEKCD